MLTPGLSRPIDHEPVGLLVGEKRLAQFDLRMEREWQPEVRWTAHAFAEKFRRRDANDGEVSAVDD